MINPIAVIYSLYRSRCLMQLFILRNQFHKLSSDMRQASASFYPGDCIVSCISVADQIAEKFFQKFCRILTPSVVLVFKNNNAAGIHFSIAIYPHLRGCCFFLQHLNMCFIGMDDLFRKKNFCHSFDNRQTPPLRSCQDPVGHRCFQQRYIL